MTVDVGVSRRTGRRDRPLLNGCGFPAIKTAFPKAKVDHSTDQTFGLTFVTIPKKGGGKVPFAVSTQTHTLTLIGIPFIEVCE